VTAGNSKAGRKRCGSRRRDRHPSVEVLEARTLPAVTTWPGLVHPISQTGQNSTLDQAISLGDLSTHGVSSAIGTIANPQSGGGDTEWYSFTLDRPASVSFVTLDSLGHSTLTSVLSLYNADVGDFNDLYNPTGFRLLAQDDGAAHGGDAQITRMLAAGTYYVAVSGSGNRYFNPFLPDSGYAGSAGNYGLLVRATDLGLAPSSAPIVLAADPAAGASISASPFVLRVDLSSALDPNTINLGSNVTLLWNAHGTFGDGTDQSVPLAGSNFSTTVDELQITPAAPLVAGYYRLVLTGNDSTGGTVLTDPSGRQLGLDGKHPHGRNYTIAFQVTGAEGTTQAVAGSDDTAATAHELGSIAGKGLVQFAGAIGDDPSDPLPFNPNDVDLYHFRITGPGLYSFQAEVFAGRIGSPLDTGVSLFRYDPSGQQPASLVSLWQEGAWTLLGANDNSLNSVTTATHAVPLYTDSALTAALPAGDYYVAVSSSGNVPVPDQGALPGMYGIFDPNSTQSGQGGGSTGAYVLNLLVQQDNVGPHVSSVTLQDGTSLSNGTTLSAPPVSLAVQLNKATNLPLLAGQSIHNSIPEIFIEDSSGNRFYPRIQTSNSAGTFVSFLMYDALPSGSYTLHFSSQANLPDISGSPSGLPGLTDLAGNPFPSTDPSGDYVIHFTVHAPVRGTGGNPLQYVSQGSNDNPSHPQDLGPLFPDEVAQGVTITQDPQSHPVSPASDAQYYRIQLLQTQQYNFVVTGASLPPGLGISIQGPNSVSATGDHTSPLLDPGTYTVAITWDPGTTHVEYQLTISLGIGTLPPGPLSLGPGPAINFQFVTPPPAGTGGTTGGSGGSSGGSTGSTGNTGGTPPPVPTPTPTPTPTPPVLAQGTPLTGNGLPFISTLLVGTLSNSSGTPVVPIPGLNGSSGGQAGSATIPSSVLLGLGSGPLSGVPTPTGSDSVTRTDVYDRVVGQTPALALVGTAVRLPILLQSPGSGTVLGGASGTELLSIMQAIMDTLSRTTWVEAVDLFHRGDEDKPLDKGDSDKPGDIVFPEEEEQDPSPWFMSSAAEPAPAEAAPALAAVATTALWGLANRGKNKDRRNRLLPRLKGRDVDRA
jgi:hypothetical protein